MNREDKVDLLVAQSIAAIRDGRLFSLPPLRVLSTNQVRWDSNIRKCALASARTARSATATITVDGVVGDRCSEEVGSITTDDLDSDPLSTNVRTEHDHLEYEYPVIDDFCQSDVCTIHNGELDGRLVAIKILIVPFNKGARALKDELWQAAMLLQVLEAVPGLVKFKGAQLTSTPRFLVLEICLCSIYDMMYRQITATGSLLSNIQDKNGAPVSILNASDDGHATEKVQKEKQDKIMPFTAIERVQCMRAVAETLLRLHSLDVPYNDLTAKNVMLACDGRFLLAEFGLSSIIRKHTARNGSNASTKDEGNVEENTSTGRCKEIYKAPELFTASESAGTKAADCYAFGALLNEVLETCSGRSPGRTAQGKLFSYHGDKEAEVDPSNSLCGLTEEASERIVILIDKCCQKNPADRPTMHAVLQTLVSIDQMIQKNIRFAIFQATVSPEDLLGEVRI